MYKFNAILALLAAAVFQSLDVSAQHIVREGTDEGPIRSRTIVLPYAFSSETQGFGLGIGASYGPESQPQSTYYGTAYYTDNDSWLGLLGGHNLQIPYSKRLYMKPVVILSRETQMRIYVDGNPDFTTERAGSNESSPENYIEENAKDMRVDLELNYVLPWGHHRSNPVHTYVTRNGILEENPSGAASWNPLQSGKSTIKFQPYYRKIFTDVEELETLFFAVGYEHDNRDFIPNPHRGYRWDLEIQHDPDWLDDTRRWTSVEGEIDGYIPLPDNDWSRQQTLALNWWTAYSPTYHADSNNRTGKPPYFTGPNLGGLWRLRGFPSNRFHDKAAMHYTAEYRVMPEWQPFGGLHILDPLMIRWWQVVGLVEIGRVAPNWNLETLHTDMKWDIGFGLRGMFNSGIGRIDFVYSEEAFSIVAMFGQSF